MKEQLESQVHHVETYIVKTNGSDLLKGSRDAVNFKETRKSLEKKNAEAGNYLSRPNQRCVWKHLACPQVVFQHIVAYSQWENCSLWSRACMSVHYKKITIINKYCCHNN